jgi:hypothetical protein
MPSRHPEVSGGVKMRGQASFKRGIRPDRPHQLAALPFRNDGVVLLLASQAGSYITGAEIVVDPSLLGTLF